MPFKRGQVAIAQQQTMDEAGGRMTGLLRIGGPSEQDSWALQSSLDPREANSCFEGMKKVRFELTWMRLIREHGLSEGVEPGWRRELLFCGHQLLVGEKIVSIVQSCDGTFALSNPVTHRRCL